MTANAAAVARVDLEVFIAVSRVDVVDEPTEKDPAAKTEGAVKAPMAEAMAIISTVAGIRRRNTPSTTPERRSRSKSRPRERRCLAASSLMSNASATAATDSPSR